METKNAKIKSTMLGYEDHGIFTCFLNLDYGGSGQGVGGRAMDAPHGENNRIGTKYGMDLIMKILDVVGVGSWEELPGKLIRVKAEHTGVHAIGNALEDEWLVFEEHAENFR